MRASEEADEASSNLNTYVFQGREVRLPVFVRRASSIAATYLISSAAARRLLPDDRLEVAQVFPGRGLLSIACIDYQDNDLGDYNEVSIALFVHVRGQGPALPYAGTAMNLLRNKLGTYIHRLPVDQSFTRDAGAGIWGFPKTVERIDMKLDKDRCRCRLVCDGEHVLTLTSPVGGDRVLPAAEMTTYSYIDGRLHETRFASGANGVGIRLGGSSLELGNHPIAEELRGLGLPKRPLMSVWMESMYGRFDAPTPV